MVSDLGVPWSDLLAAGDQPPRAAWAKLITELRTATAELGRAKQHAGMEPGIVASLRVLTAFNDYLNASPVLKADPRLGVPLLQLMAAIYMSQRGGADAQPSRPPEEAA